MGTLWVDVGCLLFVENVGGRWLSWECSKVSWDVDAAIGNTVQWEKEAYLGYVDIDMEDLIKLISYLT